LEVERHEAAQSKIDWKTQNRRRSYARNLSERLMHFGLGDRGRITPGSRADMQLMRGDSSKDISDVRVVVKV